MQLIRHSGAGRNPEKVPLATVLDPGLRRDDGDLFLEVSAMRVSTLYIYT
jgi:hypothetical protein